MPSLSPRSPAERLDQLLASGKNFIPYEENITEKEFPRVRLSIYGATETNELFISMTNGELRFVDVITSRLTAPVMADRIFGMDVLDANDAFAHAETMWELHKLELLQQ